MSFSADLYRERINKVIDHINNNLDQTLSLEELSAIACFSPFQFHGIFKTVTGETVKNFTNRIRIEKTARLLRFSTNRSADIGSACGFSDATSLSRLFRQHFGITPETTEMGQRLKTARSARIYIRSMAIIAMQIRSNWKKNIRWKSEQSLSVGSPI